MAKQKKYYVVWEGHQAGIYDSWEKCQQQIKGYPNAQFKSFKTRQEAELAFRDQETYNVSDKKKQYYYVVWHGTKPGIYTEWKDVLENIKGVKGPIYKTFGSKQLAEKAFTEHPDKYKDGDYKKTKDLDEDTLKKIGNPIELSLAVDAACNNKGDFEYQGVWTFSNEVVFRVGPYKKGSNNIGEFLALVHALAYLKQQKDEKMHILPIYSDSRIAMGWVRQKICRTNKQPPADVQQLIKRAEHWLKNNTYKNPILKWETKVWGEIPADFGRK
ncbi:viroplasmin family protein [Paracrocinitomix mangrovi]|uniref:ribonuclease H1 domain-containing protein n=1 Tax=Paracrocinitomix mangrovi TaxID=2862509 RepID=UPI003AB98C6D